MRENLTRHPILVAFSTTCKPDFSEGTTFSAPSNWKDEDKIRREIERKKEKFASEAKDGMLTGELKHIIAVSPFTESLFDSDQADEEQATQPVAVRFAHWLMEQVDSEEYPVLVGFDAKVAGRLAMFGSLREVAWSNDWWADQGTLGLPYIDPFETLVETAELRKQHGIVKMLKQMGITAAADYAPHVSLGEDLRYVATLGAHLGVLGSGLVLVLDSGAKADAEPAVLEEPVAAPAV